MGTGKGRGERGRGDREGEEERELFTVHTGQIAQTMKCCLRNHTKDFVEPTTLYIAFMCVIATHLRILQQIH